MAAGEYVSVSSQADTESADLERERRELAGDERAERAAIYVDRGLTPGVADEVAGQRMAKDALAARDQSAGWQRADAECSRGAGVRGGSPAQRRRTAALLAPGSEIRSRATRVAAGGDEAVVPPYSHLAVDRARVAPRHLRMGIGEGATHRIALRRTIASVAGHWVTRARGVRWMKTLRVRCSMAASYDQEHVREPRRESFPTAHG